jgi:hypothetical protein
MVTNVANPMLPQKTRQKGRRREECLISSSLMSDVGILRYGELEIGSLKSDIAFTLAHCPISSCSSKLMAYNFP